MTPRTAGFNTADLTLLSEVGQMIMILFDADRRRAGIYGRRYEGNYGSGTVEVGTGGVLQKSGYSFFSAKNSI